jgi:hypothetical protein
MITRFEDLFRTTDRKRDKFLSRVFAIFSEDIVRIWCRSPGSPYEDMGRPTLTSRDGGRGWTLDFCLRRHADGRIFVAEQKCELEYESYRYLTLVAPSQLAHHKGEAFRRFLVVARAPGEFMIMVRGRPVPVDGAILVWGAVSDAGRAAVMAETGLADVLSLEEIVRDLLDSGNEEYIRFVQERADWCNHLWAALLGCNSPDHT